MKNSKTTKKKWELKMKKKEPLQCCRLKTTTPKENTTKKKSNTKMKEM